MSPVFVPRFVLPVLLVVAPLVFAAGPTCLPETDGKKVEKARTVEERLRIYVKITKRQSSRAESHVRTYRPWRQLGGVGERPYPDVLVSLGQILGIHDCAWEALLEELESWNPSNPGWKVSLSKLSGDIAKAHESLRLARSYVDPWPELQDAIEASLKLIDEVEHKIDAIIMRDVP